MHARQVHVGSARMLFSWVQHSLDKTSWTMLHQDLMRKQPNAHAALQLINMHPYRPVLRAPLCFAH